MTNTTRTSVFSILTLAPVCDEAEAFYALGPCGRWWEFEYDGKPRVALVLGSARGCLWALTPDGCRSFKPEKMIGLMDTTRVVA